MMPDQWDPIDSAPKDGTPILAYVDGMVLVVKWDGIEERFPWKLVACSTLWSKDIVTHWMPLPEPPPCWN